MLFQNLKSIGEELSEICVLFCKHIYIFIYIDYQIAIQYIARDLTDCSIVSEPTTQLRVLSLYYIYYILRKMYNIPEEVVLCNWMVQREYNEITELQVVPKCKHNLGRSTRWNIRLKRSSLFSIQCSIFTIITQTADAVQLSVTDVAPPRTVMMSVAILLQCHYLVKWLVCW
jgi:hypothetical protein